MKLSDIYDILSGHDHAEDAVRTLDKIDRKHGEIRRDLGEMQSRNDTLYRLVLTMRELDGL